MQSCQIWLRKWSRRREVFLGSAAILAIVEGMHSNVRSSSLLRACCWYCCCNCLVLTDLVLVRFCMRYTYGRFLRHCSYCFQILFSVGKSNEPLLQHVVSPRGLMLFMCALCILCLLPSKLTVQERDAWSCFYTTLTPMNFVRSSYFHASSRFKLCRRILHHFIFTRDKLRLSD